MIYCDIDSTLVFNQFDLDLPENSGKSISWFEKETGKNFNFQYNYEIVKFVRQHIFDTIFLTNRGKNLQDITEVMLFQAFSQDMPVIFCNGDKLKLLNIIRRSDCFVIDNQIKFNPDFLVSGLSIYDQAISSVYNHWYKGLFGKGNCHEFIS